jgi:hypothetical protein
MIPPPAPISSPYTVRVMTVAGARKPQPAPVTAARCVDAAICSTTFVANEVTITPLRAGKTQVVVDAKNAIYSEIEQHAFEVVVR